MVREGKASAEPAVAHDSMGAEAEARLRAAAQLAKPSPTIGQCLPWWAPPEAARQWQAGREMALAGIAGTSTDSLWHWSPLFPGGRLGWQTASRPSRNIGLSYCIQPF